ncbi:MAG: PQQ-binding-like beta-propeller repeat protein [Acidobacteria bacterium]|nr:PQQ-binding-like beta-propeller repeat protein [Acidobacteriota bacterium]
MTKRRQLLLVLTVFLLTLSAAAADDWSQFRGPNGSGVSDNARLPVEFGPDKNVVWKTPLPPGHSSPVLTADRIYLTAYEGNGANQKLLVISLERATGKLLWQREIPKARKQELHKSNSPASPSPATDGQNVYAFFTDFGLLSFDRDGKERWRLPLGPFNNPFGMGASPILANDLLLLNCDSESDSFFLAVEQNTGKVRWRLARPDATRGFSTPILFQPAKGGLQVLVAGSLRLSAYDVATGKEIWFIRGLTWQIKPTPVVGRDTLYILGWAGGADPGQQEEIPSFAETLKKFDADKDRKISPEELGDPRIKKAWLDFDLDRDGLLNERDWQAYQARRSVQNGLLAYRLERQKEMRGDVTESHFLWKYQKALPNTPSPLFYQDAVYLLKEGGILTALHPKTGEVLKQGRLREAPGDYYSSPVGADGKLYTISEEGKVTVLKAGGEWEILATNVLGDSCHATPAIAGGRIYLRTHGMLYCFGQSAALETATQKN